MIMKICIGVLVGIGLFMILADRFRIPYMRTSKAVNNLAKQQKEKTSSIDVWLSSVASFIARKIRLNEFKKAQLESDLRTAQMDITPEMFTANAIVKSLIVGVFAIPVLFIFPILSPIILFLAFILYRMNMKGISNRIRAKRAKIEYELPRFVFKIEKSLMHSKDVLDSEFDERVESLQNQFFEFDVDTDAESYFNATYERVQLGDQMDVFVSVQTYVQGLGMFRIPVTVTSHRSGISEKYWK